jgi:hypothetical protein
MRVDREDEGGSVEVGDQVLISSHRCHQEGMAVRLLRCSMRFRLRIITDNPQNEQFSSALPTWRRASPAQRRPQERRGTREARDQHHR